MSVYPLSLSELGERQNQSRQPPVGLKLLLNGVKSESTTSIAREMQQKQNTF